MLNRRNYRCAMFVIVVLTAPATAFAGKTEFGPAARLSNDAHAGPVMRVAFTYQRGQSAAKVKTTDSNDKAVATGKNSVKPGPAPGPCGGGPNCQALPTAQSK